MWRFLRRCCCRPQRQGHGRSTSRSELSASTSRLSTSSLQKQQQQQQQPAASATLNAATTKREATPSTWLLSDKAYYKTESVKKRLELLDDAMLAVWATACGIGTSVSARTRPDIIRHVAFRYVNMPQYRDRVAQAVQDARAHRETLAIAATPASAQVASGTARASVDSAMSAQTISASSSSGLVASSSARPSWQSGQSNSTYHYDYGLWHLPTLQSEEVDDNATDSTPSSVVETDDSHPIQDVAISEYLENLSRKELAMVCALSGVPVGPITANTRKRIVRQLMRREEAVVRLDAVFVHELVQASDVDLFWQRFRKGPPDNDSDGYVYAYYEETEETNPCHASDLNRRLIKIGCSRNPPAQRIQQQARSNNKSYVMAHHTWTPMRYFAEACIHHLLSRYAADRRERQQQGHLDGFTEWFQINADCATASIEFVAGVVNSNFGSRADNLAIEMYDSRNADQCGDEPKTTIDDTFDLTVDSFTDSRGSAAC